MSPEIVWLVVALAAAMVEIMSPLFGFIFATPAALVGALAAWLGFPAIAQVIIFAVTLLSSLLLLRQPLLSRLSSKGVPHRTEVLVGKTGRVTVDIDPLQGAGRVLVNGEDWAASSDSSIPAGTIIRVEGADGIVLKVYLES